MRLSRKVAEHLRAVIGSDEAAACAPPQTTRIDEQAEGSIGPYEVKAVLATGGMGTVYRAIDRGTGREVAVKVPHAGSFPYTSRFERESWFARALGQWGDAPYLDHGVTSVGTPFLVMPLLEGQSLAQRIAEQGALDSFEALRVCERVSRALARLHDRRLIHRDVKPGNVLADERGGVWLLDLGLTGGPQTAVPGAGTRAYAAPEQLAGAALHPSADVFALGGLLLEALTAQRAREGVNAVEPSELRDLLRRMLAERPAERPCDGGEVARALARIGTTGRFASRSHAWRMRNVLGEVPFVGRERELARLAQQLDTHRQAWISGPPGIGKSSLVLEWWHRHAPPDAALAWAEAADKRTPQGLVQRWLDALAGLRGCESADERARARASAAPSLEAAADERPLVLVGQLADRESAGVADALRQQRRSVYVIYLEEAEAHPDSALPPLEPDALAKIAEHAPEGARIDHALAAALGNPLAFQWLLFEDGTDAEDALLRYVRKLDPYARWLLRLGSLAGPSFRAHALMKVVGTCDGPALRDGLERLADARLLIDLARETGAEAGSFRFGHSWVARTVSKVWSASQCALGKRLMRS